jgi:hypothetical protein
LEENASPLLKKEMKFDPKKRFNPTLPMPSLRKHDSMEEYNEMANKALQQAM